MQAYLGFPKSDTTTPKCENGVHYVDMVREGYDVDEERGRKYQVNYFKCKICEREFSTGNRIN